MPPVPASSGEPANQSVANDYDSFAEAYSAETEANLVNGYYCRPAILDLAGDVAGRRELFPAELEGKPRFLCFLFFVLEAV
jgi:hypothetical protein